MPTAMTRNEAILLAIGAALLLLALAGPHIAQPAHYHHFADQRTLWGLPHALDVLSNLPFAFGGLAGLWLLRGEVAGALPPVQRGCARLFFAGLVLTALCSGWYHLQPDEPGLAIDRLGMAFAFAGLLGLLGAAQVSERAGAVVAAAVLAAGPAAIAVALLAGNLLPWALLQGGGLVLLLVFGVAGARQPTLDVRWAAIVAVYAVAKLLEAGDAFVFAATGELLAGHTAKHLVAAFAAWPVLAALLRLRLRPVQNAANGAAAARA